MNLTKRRSPRPSLKHSRDPQAFITAASTVRKITACRVCRSDRLWTFFDLGLHPLANDLVSSERWTTEDYRAPLAVMRCEECHHVQLTHTVPPQLLFSDYRYTSGVAEGWHDHTEAFAEAHTRRRGARFVVDIGSNDGTQLWKFKRLGWKVLGVEPAFNLARVSKVKTECCAWSHDTARTLATDYGPADLILAQNVFGHVDDPVDFLRGVKHMLAQAGEAVIEVPSLAHLLKSLAFDTIYHEHLSYWSHIAMAKAASLAGLIVIGAQPLRTHGGSIRFTLKHHGKPNSWLGERLVREYRAFADRAPFLEFQAQVETRIREIGDLCLVVDRPFWGYAASAKASVLLNTLNARGYPVPERIVDDTKGKQGLFLPGVRVPIVAPTGLKDVKTLMLLAWNWADGLMVRAKNRGFRGRYFIPLPVPRVTDV